EFAQAKRGFASFAALFGLALAGGLFIVPSFAAVQSWSPPDRRARVIASVNVLNALYMTAAGAVLAVLQAMSVPLGALYALLGAATLVVLVFIIRSWGEEGVRDFGRLMFQL